MNKTYRLIFGFFSLFVFGCQSKSHRVIKDYANGKLVNEYLVDTHNKKDGYYKEYFPNGNLKLLYNYSTDTATGEQKSFYENGSLQAIGYYKNNQQDSVQKWFYPNGILKSEAYRLDGKLFGVQKGYAPDGKLKDLYFMVNDSAMLSSLDLDTMGRITKKKGSLICCIYNKKTLQSRDTFGVLFYTYDPPSYQYECELIEQMNGKPTRRTKASLEDINNNKAVLIQKTNMSAGDYRIGLRVRIFNDNHQLSFDDSTFLDYTVLK